VPQKFMKTDVVVIGGGVTGTGILLDLSLRGIDAILIEKEDLANGASGRFHGLLHSGGRYAVSDPESAKECIEENLILKKIMPDAIEDTGGLFIQLIEDDDTFVFEWLKGCQKAGIPVKEISWEEIREPHLTDRVKRAFLVPDASIDGFLMVNLLAEAAKERGARVKTYTEVLEIIAEDSRVSGVRVLDKRANQEITIQANIVVNAAGAWVDAVAESAGIALPIQPNQGSLLVFHHRLTNRVINRLRKPGDADIFVPAGPVTILGTTSIKPEHIDEPSASLEEIERLLDIGAELLPNLKDHRILRSYAGIRPLYSSDTVDEGRDISRSFHIINHEKDGLKGFISVLGGKLTTYRLMAEKTVDEVCGMLGIDVPGITADTKISRTIKGITGQLLCDCESVGTNDLEYWLNTNEALGLNDLRRRTRLGMGTCQGTFCGYRAAGYLTDRGRDGLEELNSFLYERNKGTRLSKGQQTVENALNRAIYLGLFNLNERGPKDG